VAGADLAFQVCTPKAEGLLQIADPNGLRKPAGLQSIVQPGVSKMTGIDFANWITIVFGLVAAWFWYRSARVRIPDYVETMVNEPGSIPSIIKRQSCLSADAAIFTAISVFAQAVAAFLKLC